MYKNKLTHLHFGELWYEVTLRNWNCMGNSRDENVAMGPCFEGVFRDYGLVAGGSTLVEVEEKLLKSLDMCMERSRVLPPRGKPMSWWTKWRLRRLTKSTCNPV